MNNIVGITLQNSDTIQYFYINNNDLKKNITVIVQTDKGLEFGKVVTNIHPIDSTKLKEQLGKVIRITTKKDYQQYKDNIRQANSALKKCKELVKKYELNMNVIDCYYTFDKNQLIFQFYSEERIDFRELAKELAYLYKTRIELRQIGVRDKAKKVGGIGSCGQKLCCARFLNEFDSVSISMAKNQNLALNPSKINGACGRLLCCLKYENDCYKECKKDLPNVGQIIKTDQGEGKVVSIDILNYKYNVELKNGNIIEIKNGSY